MDKAKTHLIRDLHAALAHFHDPTRLVKNPLVGLLKLQNTAAPVVGLRRMLLELIERLRPGEIVPYGDPEWMAHRVIYMRYIEAQDIERVCSELAIGRTKYYEHHRDALRALTTILAAQLEAEGAPTATSVSPDHEVGGLVGQEAAQVLSGSASTTVDLSALVADVVDTVRPLLAETGLTLTLNIAPDLPNIAADAAVVHQILVGLLVEMLAHASATGLAVMLGASGQHIDCRFDMPGAHLRPSWQLSPGVRASDALLTRLGGRLQVACAERGQCTVSLRIPLRQPKRVLVMDNDADTVALYKRYLHDENVLVLTVAEGETVWAALRQTQPELLLLDLLMPQENGWQILRRLKETPETASIPVIICSVLEQPRLAIALGAECVLCKPISRQELVRTVRRVLMLDAQA